MARFVLFDITNSIRHDLNDGSTVIGRGADCDIRILSSSVSRKHGALELSGDTLKYSDLGSSNGSFVNDVPVKAPVQLAPGDRLLLGDFQFAVEGEAPSASPAAAPDDDATQIGAPAGGNDVPAAWSESAGLENASGTQLGSFSGQSQSSAASAYKAGQLDLPPPGNEARVVVINGARAGQVQALPLEAARQTWKIGRDGATTDITIDDPSVSGQHAQLVAEEGRWKIVNWMSTNGTFVNGRKGLSTFLGHGDVIRLGDVEMAFELPGRKARSRPAAVAASTAPDGGGGFMAFLKRLFGGGRG